MFSKPLAFGLLAIACLTAAAGGAYVAARHNAGDIAPPVHTVQPAASESRPPTAPAVSETEVRASEVSAHPAPTNPARAQQPEGRRPSRTPPPKSEGHPARQVAGGRASATVTPPEPSDGKAAPVPVAPQDGTAGVPHRTVPPSERAPSATPPLDADPIPPVSNPPARPDNDPTPSAPPPAAPEFDELTVPASSVIGLQLETSLSSERARLEDRVEARVTRDVLVDGRVAIPAGARVLGTVIDVDRGGKLKERARLAIRFHTLVLADGKDVDLRTEPIMREGEPTAPESARKIGGAAVGGAILGAILGGGKGAMIGGMAGAGGGAAAVMAGNRNPATFPAGSIVTARLSAPATVDVAKQ